MEVRTYERVKLYKEIWAEPMTTVSKRYGISDVALRKHCKKLQIPTPPNGHWARVKAGQKIKVPPLPKYKGPDKIVVTDWPQNNSNGSNGLKMSETLTFLPEDQRLEAKKYCSTLIVPAELGKPHPLIKDTIQFLKSKKESTRPLENRVINFTISAEHKERVYRIFDTLFKAFEHLGYSIEIKTPRADRYYNYTPRVFDNVTYICSGKDGVPIYIKEKQQRVEHTPTREELAEKKRSSYANIPPYDLINTGRLNFQIDEYHAKRKNWHDSDTKALEDQVGEIVIWVMEAINVVKTMREKREDEAIRRARAERIRQQLELMRKRELEKLELLEQYASNWEKAEIIRRFADNVESKINAIGNEEKIDKTKKWLKWARGKADWLDPLTEMNDKWLGKGLQMIDLKIEEDVSEIVEEYDD